MVKVCHMTSVHNSNDVRIFKKECTSLAKDGYDTYLVAPGENREENGVHVIGVGQSSGGRILRMTALSKKVYKTALAVDADIYHVHDPELLPYGVKLKRKGRQVVFDSHENTLEQIREKAWIPRYIRGAVSYVYKIYARRAFAEYDWLISVTPSICDSLRRCNKNVVQITNYPIINESATDKPKEKDRTLCFTGGVNADWCLKEVIQALDRLNDVSMTLCGPPDNDYLKSLELLPAWNKVNYRGRVTHSEAESVQSSAVIGMAVHVYSQNYCGKVGTLGSTKLYEYMLSGIPVICTNFDLWRETIRKYQCGICVEPNDITAIAEAIRYLLENPDIAAQMGKNGAYAVMEEYNWGTQESVLFDLYDTICRESN